MTTKQKPDKTKPRTPPAAAGEIVRLPLAALCRHPDNRAPAPDRVSDLVRSIDEHDQLEPLVVRTLPDGHPHRGLSLTGSAIATGALAYQIVSGETRALAQLQRRQTEVACRIRTGCDDAEALQLLAEFNAARSDLNPLEKARLIERLCQPLADGGAGLTREAAGRIYGLQSASAASNLVRLLELTEPLQRFVASGLLPQSFAREALHYLGVPAITEAMAEEVGRWQEDGPPSREEWLGWVDQLVDEHTRSWEPATKQDKQPWCLSWCKRKLFTTKEDLGLVELPYRGKPVTRATNTGRWDALQDAAKKALQAKNVDKPTEDSGKPKTAEELAATHAEQDQQLARRIARWRHAWLRALIAERIGQKVPDHPTLVKVVLWLLSQQFGFNEHHQLRVDDRLQELVGASAMRHASSSGVLQLSNNRLTWQLVSDLVQSMLVLDEKNPDMPVWRTECVEQLATDLAIDLADAWIVLQTAASRGEEMALGRLLAFLELHNGRQLGALATEWGHYTNPNAGKAAIVKLLSTGAKIHKLPKCLVARKRGGK